MPDEIKGDSTLTPEQLAAAAAADEKLSQVVNSAITSHLKRFTEKTLPTLFESALKPVFDKMAAPVILPPAGDDEGGKKTKAKDPELAAALATIEEFKVTVAKERDTRIAAETKARNDSAHSALKSALSPHVRPELLDVLADNLFHIKKVVEFEDDGTPVFKSVQKDVFGGEEEVRLPIASGVSQYLKSEQAKAFIPAPGSSSAAPLKKTSVQQSQRTGPIDLSTAGPEEKIRYAQEVAARAEAKGPSR